jgi:hypothetical protein
MVMIEALPSSQVYEPWTSISFVTINFGTGSVLEWEAVDPANLDGNPAACSEIILLVALLCAKCGGGFLWRARLLQPLVPYGLRHTFHTNHRLYTGLSGLPVGAVGNRGS